MVEGRSGSKFFSFCRSLPFFVDVSASIFPWFRYLILRTGPHLKGVFHYLRFAFVFYFVSFVPLFRYDDMFMNHEMGKEIS